MNDEPNEMSPRGVIAGAGVASVEPSAISGAVPETPRSGSQAFDFLFGSWNVHHRRLQDRLIGSNEWVEFDGTCEAWATLGGLGNVDDNYLTLPSGPYRAMSIRKFSPSTAQWSIWWLDDRLDSLDPPVRGEFISGTGLFLGRDTYREKPIQVRFRWTGTATASPRWEQAFSPDEGRTWEPNWTMDFHRAA